MLSHVQFFATPWTVTHQAPLFMGILQARTGVGCHALLQGILPTRDGTQVSRIAGGFFTSWATKEATSGIVCHSQLHILRAAIVLRVMLFNTYIIVTLFCTFRQKDMNSKFVFTIRNTSCKSQLYFLDSKLVLSDKNNYCCLTKFFGN